MTKTISLAYGRSTITCHVGEGRQINVLGADDAARPAPVVVAGNGGYPLDSDIYQSTKSLLAADLCCEPGGVIISVNECGDGHGPDHFRRDFKTAASLEALLDDLQTSEQGDDARPDQWVTKMTADILRRRKVIAVSGASPDLIRSFGMIPAPYLGAALKIADEITGRPDAPITVLPQAHYRTHYRGGISG